jgi:hypothetical protein
LTDTERASEFEIDAASALPSPAEIEAAMGYGPGNIPAYFSSIVERFLEKATGSIRARGALATLAIGDRSSAEGWIEIGGRRFSVGPRVARRMAKAERAAVFACTIGPGLGAQARASAERGEAIEAYVIDAIASQSAENAAERLQLMAETDAAAHGLGATERYSPGYCGWPVSDQGGLFGLLPPGACGITLTESSMMLPEKSVSGFFGIGPGLRRSAYGCGDCDRLACPSRGKARP